MSPPRQPGRTRAARATPPSEPRPVADVEEAFVTRRILLLANVLRRAGGLRYRRLLGLTQSQWGLVAELGIRAPRTLNELAAAIGLDKTHMSRAAASLVRRGLVARRLNPADNREVFFSLSPAGRDVYATLIAAGLDANERLLEGLSVADRSRLNMLLSVLMERGTAILGSEQTLAGQP